MGKVEKGDRRERECKNALKQAGWTVHKKNDTQYQSGDVFGCFDVLATKNGEKPLFIQVKSNGTQGALKQLSGAKFLNREYMDIQVWSIYDRQGWRIHKLTEEGWKVRLDERKQDCLIGEKTVELYSQK